MAKALGSVDSESGLEAKDNETRMAAVALILLMGVDSLMSLLAWLLDQSRGRWRFPEAECRELVSTKT